MDDSAITCPLRKTHPWPSERKEGLDKWELRAPDMPRQCSYCGSIHPHNFISLIQVSAEVIPTDKSYKVYISRGNKEMKFYFAHLSEIQIGRFVQLLDARRITFAFPGRFYVPPAILALALAPGSPLSFSAILKLEEHVADGQVVTLIDPFYEYLVHALTADPNIIYTIDPRRWEEIIAAAYDRAGFDEVILTPRSGDLGRDVIAVKKGFGSIKFIEQVKAYNPGHRVTADDVRALLGVLQAEQDVSKAVFTTTSSFAPGITEDRLIRPFLPYRLELIDRNRLLERLIALG